MSKLLTVFGATGLQGGSLIKYILDRPELSKLFHLRGVTRDVSKAAAVSLQGRGIEIIQADMSDPASLDRAVAGSYAVFSVTNCMPPFQHPVKYHSLTSRQTGTQAQQPSKSLKGKQSRTLASKQAYLF